MAGGEASGSLSNAPLHLADLGTDNFEQELAVSLVENAVQTLDQGVGQADADDARVLRFFVWHGFPFVDAKHYTM